MDAIIEKKGLKLKKNTKQEKPKYLWSDMSNFTGVEDVSSDTSSSDSDALVIDDSSYDSTYALCSCCNDNCENNETTYKCSTCSRIYHPYCHIPIIEPRYENTKWQCTLCEDMDTISSDLCKNQDAKDLSVGTVGRKIAERILMELYCSDNDSDAFRVQPHANIFPSYYENIVYPLALNDIRDYLHNYGHSYMLNHFINDTKLVFVNNMSYFDIGDPTFDAARRLLNNLKNLHNKWVKPPTKKLWNINEIDD